MAPISVIAGNPNNNNHSIVGSGSDDALDFRALFVGPVCLVDWADRREGSSRRGLINHQIDMHPIKLHSAISSP
ncbi:hypothetical protein Ddc_04929 [Ditylenchus destructor]|nr:hypothetical protein Ddc_04929 [Ditylenchus destructor]